MPFFVITQEDGSTSEVEIPQKYINRFEKLCKQMKILLTEIQEHAPDAGLYLEGEGYPYLMGGPTHGGNSRLNPRALQGNIIARGIWWPRSSGGGW
jgi:hypothetical protein